MIMPADRMLPVEIVDRRVRRRKRGPSSLKNLPNIHPGEGLLEEFLGPMNISQNALAPGPGAGLQQPLAIAIITGLIVQYPLVLLAMPVVMGLVLHGRYQDPQRSKPATHPLTRNRRQISRRRWLHR
jgi:hypothetical protein